MFNFARSVYLCVCMCVCVCLYMSIKMIIRFSFYSLIYNGELHKLVFESWISHTLLRWITLCSDILWSCFYIVVVDLFIFHWEFLQACYEGYACIDFLSWLCLILIKVWCLPHRRGGAVFSLLGISECICIEMVLFFS